jgi:S-adenosylmethionine-diacylglycerol 3-amino-3-carboxypropyl transferase
MPRPASAATARLVDRAVVRNDAETGSRLLDKAFAFTFRGLVYAQIWEDPVVDMAALEIAPDSRVVTIASGGCNALSYLVADPARITAIDLNTAHVALNALKIAAVRHLPDHDHLRRFFAEAGNAENVTVYRELLAPHLDEPTRRYWEGRDMAGRLRIGAFTRNIYKRGLLGNFIGLAHRLARIYRIDPSEILGARDLDDQRRIFEEKFAPIFERRFVRWLTDQPVSLFGLGIPPAQYDALAGDSRMVDVLKQRLEKLACHFPVNDNYFAWQAFGRGYGAGADRSLPPWLPPANFGTIRARIDRLSIHHASYTDHLAAQPDTSLDRYVLLDAQDWMNDAQLTALWREITRTARPGARVLFRTAAEPSLLPGRLPDALLARWRYAGDESRAATAADRSSIYGGVHLYILRG